MGQRWLKSQITEAHKLLTEMGVPDRERKRDPQPPYADKDFSLGVPERITWLRTHWQPKAQQ